MIPEVVEAYRQIAPFNPYQQRKDTKKKCIEWHAANIMTRNLRTENRRKNISK